METRERKGGIINNCYYQEIAGEKREKRGIAGEKREKRGDNK